MVGDDCGGGFFIWLADGVDNRLVTLCDGCPVYVEMLNRESNEDAQKRANAIPHLERARPFRGCHQALVKGLIEIDKTVYIVRKPQAIHLPDDPLELARYGDVYWELELTHRMGFKHRAEFADFNGVRGVEPCHSATSMGRRFHEALSLKFS